MNECFFREDLEDEDTALAFLYVSDDMEWGRKNIKTKGHKDLFFVGEWQIKFFVYFNFFPIKQKMCKLYNALTHSVCTEITL